MLAGLEAKKHPSDWDDNAATRFTSIRVSSYDKQVLLLENNRVAGSSRMHLGTILILADLPLHPDTRSGADFVIMS